MPNWVWNKLTIHKKYKDFVLKNDVCDFSVIAPEPESLNYTISPVPEEYMALYGYVSKTDPEKLRNYAKRNNQTITSAMMEIIEKYKHIPQGPLGLPSDIFEKYPTALEYGKMYIDLINTYHCSNWYDFHIEHWGCKWNATESSVDVNPENNDYIDIYFDTPWRFPSEWLKKLCSKNIPFHHSWTEEQGYRGVSFSNGKTLICKDIPELRWFENEDGEYEEFTYVTQDTPQNVERFSVDEDEEHVIADPCGDYVKSDAVPLPADLNISKLFAINEEEK